MINSLNMHDGYNLEEEFVIPLLLQDKLNVVETLVSQHRNHQIILVQFFDRISTRGFDLSTIIPPHIKVVHL